MTNERFQELVKELRDKSMDTMLKKNANYADEDRLHNFKVGAAITGGTPAQAALGYMAKHLASLQDKVRKDDFHDREDLLEKCQDIINYVVFIWCCGNEEMEKYKQEQLQNIVKQLAENDETIEKLRNEISRLENRSLIERICNK